MTDQERHDDMKPPGRPLWLAAERKRVSEGWTKLELVKQIGIGRVTFDRLYSQPTPPIARTVKKVADVVGLDYDEAMRLAGLDRAEGQLPALTGSFQASTGVSPVTDVDIQILVRRVREIADQTGKTLGDVLVDMGLAQPGELTVTGDQVVKEIAGDDLPEDLKKEFLDGYRRLREQVAADARRRSSS